MAVLLRFRLVRARCSEARLDWCLLEGVTSEVAGTKVATADRARHDALEMLGRFVGRGRGMRSGGRNRDASGFIATAELITRRDCWQVRVLAQAVLACQTQSDGLSGV